jgi:hypothetical protein
MEPTKVFTKEEVEAACKNNKNMEGSFCTLKIKMEKMKRSFIRILAQYTDEAIRLIDGLSHSVHSTMRKSEPKYFYVGVHNFETITVILENKVGEYKVYASLMAYDKFMAEKVKLNNNIFPNKQSKDVESSNPLYYHEQMISIPQAMLKDKCPESTGLRISCVMLLSVVLEGSSEVIKAGKFSIEATQQNRQLRDGTPMNGYLQKRSVAFYHFENEVKGGTLIININNQNKNCLDIYARMGSERASSALNDKTAKASNSLLVPNTVPGTYSITL